MGHTIHPFTKSDIRESFAVGFKAFARPNQGLYRTYPISPSSFDLFVASQEESWEEPAATIRYFKATDEESGKLISVARWSVYFEDQAIEKSVEELVAGRLKVDLPEMRRDVARDYYTMVYEGKREVMGVVERGEVVGMKKRVELDGLLTDPEYQRRGLGGMFLRQVVGEADELGLVAYLEATEEGRPLYEKFGFAVVKTVDFVYGDSGVEHQFTFMVRQPKTLSSS